MLVPNFIEINWTVESWVDG